MERMYLAIKRLMDIAVALVVLLLLGPLLLCVALILRFSGEGEVLYLQERVGYKNRPFRIWKFVTMLKESPNLGTKEITVRHDPRVLTVGRYLRMAKLNELPQVVNVLIGDMNLVGPRPLMPESFKYYPPDIQARIYDSRPGITGIGSVIFRDEERLVSASDLPPLEFYKKHIFPYKGAIEMWYRENRSLVVDAKIIFLTAWVLLIPSSTLPRKVFKDLPPRDF